MVFVIISLPAVKDVINVGRTSLTCGDPTLTTMQQMTCIGIDALLLVFFGFGMAYTFYWLWGK
jgi:hypothetical protein